LKNLWLFDCGLKGLEVGLFDGLESLEWLEIQSNPMTSVEVGLFDGLSLLKKLWLDDCGLIRLEAGIFSDLGSLAELRLFDNNFTTMEVATFDVIDCENVVKFYNDSHTGGVMCDG